MDIERRDYSLEELEVRETSEGRTIRGMAVPVNRNSQDLGGFIERVDSKAIELDGSDVVMLWQHDSAQPITRESTGLKLELRSSGLWFEAAASDFTDRQLELLERGVVKQMSFGFLTLDDSWETERKPVPRRTLTSINLREISPVTWPAYNATKVAVRPTTSRPRSTRTVAPSGRSRRSRSSRARNGPNSATASGTLLLGTLRGALQCRLRRSRRSPFRIIGRVMAESSGAA